MSSKQKIAPCLWFDDQAEAAAKFYAGIFPNSRISETSRYAEAGREIHGKPPGSVMTVEFDLADENSAKSRRAMQAMLQMKKLDIEELKRAYEG